MRKEVVFTYLDLKFIPNYPVDRSILPGFPTTPNDILEDFIKTEHILWVPKSQKDLPKYLDLSWENFKPLMCEWFNERFSQEHGKIEDLFQI